MLVQLRRMFVAAALAVGTFHVPYAGGVEPVDVNRASVQELMHVPGITEVWARRILHFRPYRSKLDLLNQGVVSRQVYTRIRDSVVAHRMRNAR